VDFVLRTIVDVAIGREALRDRREATGVRSYGEIEDRRSRIEDRLRTARIKAER
jgi:hypothetical protein